MHNNNVIFKGCTAPVFSMLIAANMPMYQLVAPSVVHGSFSLTQTQPNPTHCQVNLWTHNRTHRNGAQPKFNDNHHNHHQNALILCRSK